MDNTFLLEILTPDRSIFSEQCESLTVTLEDGEATILIGHAPMLAMLPEGEIIIRGKGKLQKLHTTEAFLKVSDLGVELFSRNCQWIYD